MTNILSLTDDQLALVASLLEPSITRDDETGEVNDEENPVAAHLAQQIDRLRPLNDQRNNVRLFLSLYETRQYYGGPEEGGWYYFFTECVESELLGLNALVDQWNELVCYCADEYGQVQTPDETTMLTASILNEAVNRVDRNDLHSMRTPLFELHFTDNPHDVEAIITIERVSGCLADTHRPHYC